MLVVIATVLTSCTETELEDEQINQIDLSKIKNRPGNSRGR
jgi:tRNA 2-selenouridine synthase SelU